MKLESGDLVMPGDFLGIIEQYEPGEGTFDDNGDIKSSILGNVTLDSKTRKVSVAPLTGKPVLLERGDMVYGQITDVRSQRALIDVQIKKDEDRQLALPYLGAIHVSQVKNDYLDRLTDAFRIGDIVGGKVSRIAGENIDLNTEDDDCGVVKAMCTRCRDYLEPTGRKDELICPTCGKKEKRKISANYLY
ncbi:exosome complex RNA-binding protein Csl4 [Methanobrevibacter sp.]